jgi:serine/threonine protein kinase
VHLALHLPTSEKVAVKIIDKCRMRAKDVQRVVREIEVLKRIRHRHVVTLYEIIETEKSLLLVTEFLPQGELFRHIIKEKR